SHAEIQEGDEDRTRHAGAEEQALHPLEPGELADVKAEVSLEQRVGDTESRSMRREPRRHPPVPCPEGEQEAEDEAGGEGAAQQHHDQRGGAGDQPRPPAGARHARMPSAASQSSTSARYAARAESLPASNRSTRTGWVFDARTSPQPSGNVMRTPSSVDTEYRV